MKTSSMYQVKCRDSFDKENFMQIFSSIDQWLVIMKTAQLPVTSDVDW